MYTRGSKAFYCYPRTQRKPPTFPFPPHHTAETIDRRPGRTPHALHLKKWVLERQPANRVPSSSILCSWITTAPLVDTNVAQRTSTVAKGTCELSSL